MDTCVKKDFDCDWPSNGVIGWKSRYTHDALRSYDHNIQKMNAPTIRSIGFDSNAKDLQSKRCPLCEMYHVR